MVNIAILVVLYNKGVEDSETLLSLLRWDDEHREKISELIIWNNSVNQLKESEISMIKSSLPYSELLYIGDGINHPLSYVYNQVISSLKYSNGWLIILDHDSSVSQFFLDEILDVIKKDYCPNLILPQIYYNSTLVSPARQYYFLGRYFKTVKAGLMSSRFKTAINSGMCININYLKSKYPGYNERIKFYGTDNDFMRKYSKDNERLYVLNEKVNHVLNFYNDVDQIAIQRRFKDIKNGMIELIRDINPMLVPLAYIYWGFYSLKFALKKNGMQYRK